MLITHSISAVAPPEWPAKHKPEYAVPNDNNVMNINSN